MHNEPVDADAIMTMIDKWNVYGEDLTHDEAAYLAATEGDPGFNDFSSREVLAAYRAGRIDGSSRRAECP